MNAGARSTTSVPPEHLRALEAGTAEARTLSEALAIDHRALLAAAVPHASRELTEATAAAQQLGILRRMSAIGDALRLALPNDELAELADHPSDTVRGWWCFALGAEPDLPIPARLERAAPRADDACFTVREWVWMALRPRLTEDLPLAVEVLATWTTDPSPRIRRFASESLRPRGVWARQIREFTERPELGEPLLEPLRADPERSVQDSVANWINDAAKTRPDWAGALTERWLRESPSAATERIVGRALRSIPETRERLLGR